MNEPSGSGAPGAAACLAAHPAGTVLRLRATPNAARTQAEGLRGARLALRVKAPPVEGKANAEVLRWAAEAFGLKKSGVSILRGEKSRDKDLLLAGLSSDEAGRRLAGLPGMR